jgi:aarF domain-containing kinase
MKYFSKFDTKPFAAASIGQVHLAYLKDSNKKVAVKIQYPGVEKSIRSDIDNLMTLLSVANLLPKGLYVENVIKHVKTELFNECDYIREAKCSIKFQNLLKNDPAFLIPNVDDKISTKHVLITDFAEGIPVDQCLDLDQEQRNHVIYYLVLLLIKTK